jgi:hypothetical protein
MLACLEPRAADRASVTPGEHHVDEDETTGMLPNDLERLLAGTLALMTAWYQCPQPAICHKLIDNLTQIGRHERVDDPLRRVCANAAARWAGYLEEVEAAIAEGGADDDDGDDDDDGAADRVGDDGGRGRATLH